MDDLSPHFNTECCIRCNNYELVRAVRTQNKILFDTILNSKRKISCIKVKHGCRMVEDVVSLSLSLGTEYFFERLMAIQYHHFVREDLEREEFELGSAGASR